MAWPASAHERSFKTRITISEPEPFQYAGRVFSGSAACVRFRELQMWRDGPGDDDEYLSTFNADRQGRWVFHFVGDEYYVRAKRFVAKRSARHRHVCRAGRSPTA